MLVPMPIQLIRESRHDRYKIQWEEDKEEDWRDRFRKVVRDPDSEREREGGGKSSTLLIYTISKNQLKKKNKNNSL